MKNIPDSRTGSGLAHLGWGWHLVRGLMLGAGLMLGPATRLVAQVPDQAVLLQGVGNVPVPSEPDIILTTWKTSASRFSLLPWPAAGWVKERYWHSARPRIFVRCWCRRPRCRSYCSTAWLGAAPPAASGCRCGAATRP